MSSSQRLKVLVDDYGSKEIVNDLVWLLSMEKNGKERLTELKDHFNSRIEVYSKLSKN